ncbi:MAG: bile acid:sodium symporter family protein [Ignavibacteria bacterium]|jgi:BASS family bile acid:Na+ symporter
MLPKIISFIENQFLIIVVILSVAALIIPSPFTELKPLIPFLLGVIMFGMGVTLKFEDFKNIWQTKHLVLLGVAAQYLVMPLLAFIISIVLGLPKEIMIGMIVLGACPGGTASNVICYLAKANVALSITLTLVSTILAPLLTPGIIYLFLAEKVDIHFWEMVNSVFWIVIFPLVDGLLIRHFFYKRFQPILAIFPSISILTISIVIACVVALNQTLVLSFPLLILTAVILHNLSGLSIGYGFGKLFRCSDRDAKTLAIEVGMQNSGLSVALTTKFFTSAAALPGALFSLWHNVSGIILAKFWSKDL